MATVICGQCGTTFESELESDALAAELDHVCSATGVKPTDPQSMGEDYALIQRAALERGLARLQEESPDQVPVQEEAIQQLPEA